MPTRPEVDSRIPGPQATPVAHRRIAWLLCLFMWVMPAYGQGVPKRHQVVITNSHGFLAAHPDLRWRREGLQELREDRPGQALAYFKRAARYADKPSQAMVAEMLWTGWGVPVDKPLAYAWMDLAAERAYLPFLAKREEYWSALDDAGRERALEVGAAVYADYGDVVAKPRLARELRLGRRATGSRTGFVGSLKVQLPGGTVDGSQYYDRQYWQPDQYWEWQDGIWKAPKTGNVAVRPLEVVREADEADEAGQAPAPGTVGDDD